MDAAQAAIDTVYSDMNRAMSKMMPKADVALVHALLDEAKTRLTSAEDDHEKALGEDDHAAAQGAFNHARAIAEANTARAYAEAADILHLKLMKE